jgi:hypothetical protein
MTTVRRRIARELVFAILCVVAVVMLYPFYFMAITSLRSYSQYLRRSGFSLDSWAELFDVLPVLQQLFNSTLVTCSAVAIILVGSTMGGFAFAKLRFPGRTLVLLAIVSGMMVPLQSLIIPEFVNIAQVGLINQFQGAILVCAALGAPFATFLMTTYFRVPSGSSRPDHRRRHVLPDLPPGDDPAGHPGAGDRRSPPVHPDLGRPPDRPALPADTGRPHDHGRPGDPPELPDHQRPGAHGGFAGERPSGRRRLPDLPAQPDRGATMGMGDAESGVSARERRLRITELLEDSGGVRSPISRSLRRDRRVDPADLRITRRPATCDACGEGGAGARGRRDGVYQVKARENRERKVRTAPSRPPGIGWRHCRVRLGSTVAQVIARRAGPCRGARSRPSRTRCRSSARSQRDSPHLVCLGGLYLPDYEALVGPQTIADMRDLSADLVFIGCDGLAEGSGLTTAHVLVAEVGATMASRARRVVVVADSTKLGRRGFTPIVPLAGVDVLVTDGDVDHGALGWIRAAGIEVVLA